MVEKQPVRKEGQGQQGEGQGREPMPLGEGRTSGTGGEGNVGKTGDVTKEALLREQQLSTERQKEGHGWHGLKPGESSGTTPLPDTESTSEGGTGSQRQGGHTPSAHKAELMGEGSGGTKGGERKGERPDEETQGGVRSQRTERRGT